MNQSTALTFKSSSSQQIRTSLVLGYLLFFFSVLTFAQEGLKAEYYDGMNFEQLVATQYEPKIDHYWNDVPPVPGIDPHVCSIRWTGKLRPGKSGKYTFSARVDDGIRVWIDDELIIDDWDLNDVGIFKGSIQLNAGVDYTLKVEYFNALIEGEIRLLWNIPKEKTSWWDRFKNKKFEIIEPQFFLPPTPVQEIAVAQLEEKLEVEAKAEPEPEIVAVDVPDPKKKVGAKPPPKQEVKKEVIIEKKPEIVVHKVLSIDDVIPTNVIFERAQATIIGDSHKQLDKFAEFLIRNPKWNVKIEGHTDPMGDESDNMTLSERRAYACASYLVKQGVNHERLSAEGFGGSRPLKVPEDGEYYPKNRRVEFVVTDMEIVSK